MDIAMATKWKYLGRMDQGLTKCGRIVMNRWDQPERANNAADLGRFINDLLRRSGFTHSSTERYEGEPMPDWVGQSKCSDLTCACQKFRPITPA